MKWTSEQLERYKQIAQVISETEAAIQLRRSVNTYLQHDAAIADLLTITERLLALTQSLHQRLMDVESASH